jgi:hypothetical protein
MTARMAREMKLLTNEPPPGVFAWPNNDRLDNITAQLQAWNHCHRLQLYTSLILFEAQTTMLIKVDSQS